MAKKLPPDGRPPRLSLTDAYAMIGEIKVNLFHQTAELSVYVFDSEDARHQRLAPTETDLHRPVKVITVQTTFDTYATYIEAAAKALAAAGYKLITEVPASAAISPHGLKELLEGAEDI